MGTAACFLSGPATISGMNQCLHCQHKLEPKDERCPGCRHQDPRGRRQTLAHLHALDVRIVAGASAFLLALGWLSIRWGAWDWVLLLVPAALLLFALLPRPDGDS